jgi:APA family basic amino acid/polyamine antiporter
VATASQPDAQEPTALVRGLGAWDGALITIGSVLGTGIFITTGDMAKVLPHPGLILAAWVLGGLLTLAGALSYSELGAMFPRAGGQYHFLKEAYGTLPGFLFGWGAFFIVMSGGIAALAAGFGEYLGSFLPFFSTQHVLFEVSLDGWKLAPNGGQLAGGLAIALLSWVNYIGVREGAGLQNAVTIVKIGSLVGLAGLGLFVPATTEWHMAGPVPAGVFSAFGIAMVAVFWTYDGWYGVTNLAGEMRNPGRDVPLGLLMGTAALTTLYTLLNIVYVRALPVGMMGETARIGEAAAAALFGPSAARLVSAAVLVSTFGCISATILYSARIYLPMAQDGVFFRSFARIHPRYRTPNMSILAQGAWAILLTFSGSYDQLYTYVVFAVVLFHAATAAGVFVLRRTQPTTPRPYRTWGYPLVPAIFIAACVALVANTLIEKPRESLVGLGLLLLGLPAYAWWRRSARDGQTG